MGGNVRPLGDGQSTRNKETGGLSATFPLSDAMSELGYRMSSASIDESGFFLNIEFENLRLNHVRHLLTNEPICENPVPGFVKACSDYDRNCPKCEVLFETWSHE